MKDKKIDEDLIWLHTIKIQTQQDNIFKPVIKCTNFKNKEQKSLYKQWNCIFIIKGTLYRAWTIKTNGSNRVMFQLLIPKQERRNIMQKANDLAISGHGGVLRTQNRIKERFYWPSWENDVRKYVLSCDICQRVKAINETPNAPLTIIESNFPFQIIQSDIAGEFNESYSGNKWLLVLVDHFSK
jgi:hypothetical protein